MRMEENILRITVEIDENTLRDVLRITGERKKSTALSKAVAEFINRKKAAEFGRLIRENAFDYPLTNEEIEG